MTWSFNDLEVEQLAIYDQASTKNNCIILLGTTSIFSLRPLPLWCCGVGYPLRIITAHSTIPHRCIASYDNPLPQASFHEEPPPTFPSPVTQMPPASTTEAIQIPPADQVHQDPAVPLVEFPIYPPPSADLSPLFHALRPSPSASVPHAPESF